MEPKKILIVEDDDFLRSLAVTKLQKEGFAVDIAVDGPEGLEKIDSYQPDLILLDLLLPQIDGFQILENMNESGKIRETKVVIFSNLGSTEDIKRGKDLGVEHYLVKANFTLDELVIKIKEVINS